MILSRRKVVFAVGLALAVATTAIPLRAQEKDKPPAKAEEPAAPKPTPEQQKRINQLIVQLAADGFDEREQAQKELEKIGPAALESLRKATKNPDAEIVRRAADLVARLEELLKSGQQLAPKKVHLKLDDAPVAEAVAALSKQSGYPIQVGGDKAKLAARKVTLDTGEVSFWEAFDKLCQKAGLVEPARDGQTAPGALQVVDGTPAATPTCYAGALRVRVVPGSVQRKDGATEFLLELSIEPRFRQPKVLGAARVLTALDPDGKALAGLEAPSLKAALLRAPVGLKWGEKKALKELSGSVLFETVLAEKVLAIDDVPKSAGKAVKNDEGATLRLDAYEKKGNGDVSIRTTLSKPLERKGGAIMIGPETFKEFQPDLKDANGLPYQKVAAPSNGITLSGNLLSITQTITYRPQPGCGEPAELSLTSDRSTPLRVPFSFKNLTLP
jgi:hypothetical protein